MVRSKNKIPPRIKRKKIDVNSFEKLALRVKGYFEEEEKFLEKTKKDEYNKASRFLPNY